MSVSKTLPGPAYLDSSALVKLYVSAQSSEQLDAVLAGRTDLIASDFALTEAMSAVCRLQREGALSREAKLGIHRQFLSHANSGLFELADLNRSVYRAAERRLLNSGGVPLRAGDALHLALALAGGCRTMITFDHRLAEASGNNGLFVFPDSQ